MLKCEVLKIAKRVNSNQDITWEKCLRNDDGVSAMSNEDKIEHKIGMR